MKTTILLILLLLIMTGCSTAPDFNENQRITKKVSHSGVSTKYYLSPKKANIVNSIIYANDDFGEVGDWTIYKDGVLSTTSTNPKKKKIPKSN